MIKSPKINTKISMKKYSSLLEKREDKDTRIHVTPHYMVTKQTEHLIY